MAQFTQRSLANRCNPTFKKSPNLKFYIFLHQNVHIIIIVGKLITVKKKSQTEFVSGQRTLWKVLPSNDKNIDVLTIFYQIPWQIQYPSESLDMRPQVVYDIITTQKAGSVRKCLRSVPYTARLSSYLFRRKKFFSPTEKSDENLTANCYCAETRQMSRRRCRRHRRLLL